MDNFNPNQLEKPSCFHSSNDINSALNHISNDTQDRQTNNQDSQTSDRICNFNQPSVDIIHDVLQVASVSVSNQTNEQISQNGFQAPNPGNQPEKFSDSNPVPNIDQDVSASSGNNQANRQINQNGLQASNFEKKSEEPSCFDPIHDINRTVNNIQGAGNTKSNLQVLDLEKKFEGPSCFDSNYNLNKTLSGSDNNQINGNANKSKLKPSDSANEANQASCFNAVHNINSDILRNLNASQDHQANHEANAEQRASEESKVNQINGKPEQKSGPPNQQLSSLQILAGTLTKDPQKNQQNKNRVSYIFGENEMPEYFSNDAEHLELEQILKDKFSEIVRTSRKIDQISMKKIEEEKEEQKIPEKDDLQGGDFASVLSGYELIEMIGKGAHGVVYRVRNREGEIKALKTYRKKCETEFINEVAILSMLDANDMGGQVGIAEIFETKEYYGVVLSAGIGNLLDFKKFLQERGRNLNEDQIINVFMQLYKNIQSYQMIEFAHRDIKPENIIIYISSEQFQVEIIDYSLALSLDSEILSGAGTLGYIDPYLTYSQNQIVASDLLRGDLFSLGITLLELAVPSFTSEQNDWIGIEKALSRLSDKPRIYNFLKYILNEENNRSKRGKEGFDEYLSESGQLARDLVSSRVDLDNSFSQEEWQTGFEKESEDFQKYLNDKFRRKTDKEEKLSNEAKDNESQTYFKAIQFTKKDPYSDSPPALDLNAVDQALDYFIETNDILNQMLCYENLLKHFIQIDDLNAIRTYSDLLLDLASGLDKTQLEKFIEPHFMFSTLGVANYKLSNIGRACELFKKGLEMMIANEGDKMILLNNLACALSMIEDQQQEASNKFQEVYNLTIKQIESFSYMMLESWLCRKASDMRSTDLVKIGNSEPSRSFDYMLLAEKVFPKAWKEPIDDALNFFFVIFQNYCFHKAQNILALFRREQNQHLLNNLRNISHSLNLQKCSPLRLDFQLEVLLNLSKLAIIFRDVEGGLQQSELLHQVNQNSSNFLKRKEELIALHKDNKLDLLTKELEEFELLTILMVGLANHLGSNKQLSTKQALKNVIKDVAEHFSKHEVNVKTLQGSPLYGRVFSRSFRGKTKVPFQEINDCAREFITTGNASMSLIPDKLAQSYGLNSCGYKVIFSGDESCPKLILNFLDLSYSSELLSDLKQEDLEFLVLEIRDRQYVHDKNISLLCQCLAGLEKLKRIELHFTLFTEFEGHMFEPIAKAFTSLRELQELKIVFGWGNNNCATTINYLQKAIKELHKLKNISLLFGYHSNLTDQSIVSLAKTLCGLENLKHVTLQFCACASISIPKMQEVQDLLQTYQKDASVVVYPMWLY